MAEKHELGTRMGSAQPLTECDLVFDHAVPGVGAGVAGLAGAQPGAAVAAMVGGVDRVAAGHSKLREAVVAAAVLGCPVHDLQHGLGRTSGQPSAVIDAGAVGGAELLPVGCVADGRGASRERGRAGRHHHLTSSCVHGDSRCCACERRTPALAERPETSRARGDDGRRVPAVELRGGRAAPHRVREDVEVREWTRLAEGVRPFEGLVPLAREPRDQVGADGGVGQQRTNHRQAFAREPAVVAPPHAREHAVVGGLERHVQVVTHGRRVGHHPQEQLAHLVRVDRRQPEPRHERLLGDRGHEPGEVDGRVEVVSVATEVHAGEDDLLEALRGERRHFGQHHARRQAPAGPARHRHDAERAEEVAALLHLQERARLPREAARAHGRDRALPPARADDGPRHGCTGHGAGEGVEPVEADHVVHGLDCRRLFGPGLGIAAGEDYPRVRVQAMRAAREATALGVGRVGHRARVDDDHVGRGLGRHDHASLGTQPVGDRGAVVGVHLAAERDDGNPAFGRHGIASAIQPPPRTRSLW